MAWRYCGSQIKLWREKAGVTRDKLAQTASYEYETIKSMETGRRRPTLRVLQVADELCGAGGLLLAAQDYLKPEKFPARSREFMLIEAEAITIHSYEALLIPGLLQTEAYARALINESCPPRDDETIEARIAARLQRQGKLTCKPLTHCSFVLYEGSLRSLVGGRAVMKEQLLRLVELGKLRNVSIQVLPVDKGANSAALDGSFVLLETADHEHYAYIESQDTSTLYSDPDRLSSLSQRYGMIRMQALNVEASAEFISKLAEEL
ncbi:helix-turn-helix domain-containing protein [Streptomyces sp. PTM05]|uniref:Helix-turn-helix domain-containing protein n=2 Tax=Streptantibioticus parmotrematis TaxID=2873249 RepID=A0ABS7QLR5_9ACTN|nr:helix-turn-helix domain-containing protein [Streptantibioticus parmotrematis]